MGVIHGGESTSEEVGKPRRLASAFYYAFSLCFSSDSLITVRWFGYVYFLGYGGSKPSLSTVFSMVNML